MQEKEKEIAEREQRLKEQENRLLALKAIKEIGLDDGSVDSMALVDFVMGEDEAAIKERVKTFDALVKRFVQAQVDKVFKTNGRTPGVGSTATGDTGAVFYYTTDGSDPRNSDTAVVAANGAISGVTAGQTLKVAAKMANGSKVPSAVATVVVA